VRLKFYRLKAAQSNIFFRGMKQKTEIVFEVEELVTVKCRTSFTVLCERCNSLPEMLTDGNRRRAYRFKRTRNFSFG